VPLAEILSRLNPLDYRRRPGARKHVEVPEEFSSPFDPENRSLIFSVGPSESRAGSRASPEKG